MVPGASRDRFDMRMGTTFVTEHFDGIWQVAGVRAGFINWARQRWAGDARSRHVSALAEGAEGTTEWAPGDAAAAPGRS